MSHCTTNHGMDATRFARITASGHAPFSVGDVVEVAFYEQAYVVGHGLDQQIVGIKVRSGDDELLTIPLRDIEFIGAGEAKAWRTTQKKARSRARRNLD